MPDIRTRKRQLLEEQLEALWQDYEAAIKQTTMALGAVDRNRAEREAEEIFKKIEKLDSELRLPEAAEPVKGEPDAGHLDAGYRVGADDRAAPGSSPDTATRQELINLLAPLMGAESERRALLTLALGSEAPVLRRLQFGGAVEPFIVNMINGLTAFGEMAPGRSALWALLAVRASWGC